MRHYVTQLCQATGINLFPVSFRRRYPVTRTTVVSLTLVTLIALSCMPSQSAAYIPPPPKNPHIEDFWVNWEILDEEQEIYCFTFSGTAVDCEELESFEIVMFGGPFSATVTPGANGYFSVDFHLTASEGFSYSVLASIHAYGHRVSPYVQAST